MTDTRPKQPAALKPVRLPASATLALPRWGLILLCALYILPGLFGRDPWKNMDAFNFGIMWTMAQGTLNDWFYPNIAGLPISKFGPLTFWIGAFFIKVFGNLTDAVSAARMATLLFFLLAAWSVWQAAYILGRRPEAQPMRLAFGGHPEPNDYGRVLADGSLLIYLGCLGLFLLSHETSVNALHVALIAFTLFRSASYFDRPESRNALLLGFSLGCLALTSGLVTPAALYLVLFCIALLIGTDFRRFLVHFAMALAITSLLLLSWIIVTEIVQPYGRSPVSEWLKWNLSLIDIHSLNSINFFFRKALWGFWPAWPFACWALWAWRRQLRDLHVLLPLAFASSFFLLAVLSFHTEEALMLAMFPPLAILAAFGLPTMKRGAINAVDWFSVIIFTMLAAVIWLCWIAAQTGWPPKIARNAFKLAPGFVPELNFIAVSVALVATVGWFVLAFWRLSRQPTVLWRAVVLSTGGILLCWLLLATLWLPWINYNKSYVSVARQIDQSILDKSQCVDTNAGLTQRSIFAYSGHVRFSSEFESRGCDYLLLQDTFPRNQRPLPEEHLKGMVLLWHGHRPGDRTERFRLYQYKQHQSDAPL